MRGHIAKKGKRWYPVIDIRDENGKRKRKWLQGFDTKKAAQAFLNEKLNEIQKGTFVQTSDMTVADYLRYWLNNYAKPNTAPRTYEGYEMIVDKHLIPALGHLKLEKLQPLHIQKYYTDALVHGRKDGKGGLSHRTVLHHHRVLHEALGQAVKWQLVVRNVADAVEPPRPERHEMQTLTSEQVRILLEEAKKTQYYALIYTAIHTGMRRGELLGLRWQDINFDTNTISVRQTLQRVVGKGLIFREPKTQKSRRPISIPPSLCELLKKLKIQQAKDKLLLGEAYQDLGLVFTQRDGTPFEPSEVGRVYRSILKKANLPPVRFHDLRHTHATLLLEEGIHPKVVSERLGHSTIGITLDTYSHVLPTMQEEAALRLDEKLSSTQSSTEMGRTGRN
jgi:integrase